MNHCSLRRRCTHLTSALARTRQQVTVFARAGTFDWKKIGSDYNQTDIDIRAMAKLVIDSKIKWCAQCLHAARCCTIMLHDAACCFLEAARCCIQLMICNLA